MPGQRPLLVMGFIASLGITFEVLACVKNNGTFWPLLVVLFYILLPIPMIMARRTIKETMIGINDGSGKKVRDFSLFVTAGIMVSSVALPMVMARSPAEAPSVSRPTVQSIVQHHSFIQERES